MLMIGINPQDIISTVGLENSDSNPRHQEGPTKINDENIHQVDDTPNRSPQKTAPRSGNQFKVGPSFQATVQILPIHIVSTNEIILPIINARIDRGFDLINNEWIGYKRNYFTLVSAFEFEGHDDDIVSREKFYTVDKESGSIIEILSFGIKLESRCCEDNSIVDLIQHTAKRDRGPQYSPPEYFAIPGELPSHEVIKKSANIRNESKVTSYNRLFFLDFSEFGELKIDCVLKTYPVDEPAATVSRYERIQFSSAVNYRKPILTHRSFSLNVILFANIKEGKRINLAYSKTPALIIRGRSPSNYRKLFSETYYEISSALDQMTSTNESQHTIEPYDALQHFDVNELLTTLKSKRGRKSKFELMLLEKQSQLELQKKAESTKATETPSIINASQLSDEVIDPMLTDDKADILHDSTVVGDEEPHFFVTLKVKTTPKKPPTPHSEDNLLLRESPDYKPYSSDEEDIVMTSPEGDFQMDQFHQISMYLEKTMAAKFQECSTFQNECNETQPQTAQQYQEQSHIQVYSSSPYQSDTFEGYSLQFSTDRPEESNTCEYSDVAEDLVSTERCYFEDFVVLSRTVSNEGTKTSDSGIYASPYEPVWKRISISSEMTKETSTEPCENMKEIFDAFFVCDTGSSGG